MNKIFFFYFLPLLHFPKPDMLLLDPSTIACIPMFEFLTNNIPSQDYNLRKKINNLIYLLSHEE